MGIEEIRVPVTGMTCVNCAANITRAVKKLPGVTDASVNFAAETAIVFYDAEKTGIRDIVGQIDRKSVV